MRQRICALLIVWTLLISMPVGVGLAEHNYEGTNRDNTPAPLSFQDLRLGNLSIGMSLKQINDAMTLKPYLEEKGTVIHLTYPDGTKISLFEGEVRFIEVVSSLYPTPRGLKVGDTTQKVLGLYGEPPEILKAPKNTFWYYSLGETRNLTIVFNGDSIQKTNGNDSGILGGKGIYATRGDRIKGLS